LPPSSAPGRAATTGHSWCCRPIGCRSRRTRRRCCARRPVWSRQAGCRKPPWPTRPSPSAGRTASRPGSASATPPMPRAISTRRRLRSARRPSAIPTPGRRGTTLPMSWAKRGSAPRRSPPPGARCAWAAPTSRPTAPRCARSRAAETALLFSLARPDRLSPPAPWTHSGRGIEWRPASEGDDSIGEGLEMTSKRRGLRELYAEDPERADWLVFGRIAGPGRRGFLKGAGLATMSAVLGAGIPFHRNMPAGLIPSALADEPKDFVIEGKGGLIVLNDRPVNAETPAHLLDDAITPTERHFIRNNGNPPDDVDPAAWKLTIDGEVDNPLELTIDDLRNQFEVVTLQLQLECGGNGRAGFHPPAS